MITQLVLPPALDAEWRSKIERQLDLTLASVHWQIKRLVLVLDVDPKSVGKKGVHALYRCQLEAKLRSGRSHKLKVNSRDPQACAADVAARLRREIIRDKHLGLQVS